MTKYTCTILLLLGFFTLSAQTIDYRAYIDSVMARNIDLSIARLDVEASHADLEAAKTIQDPSLSIEYGNNSDWLIAMGQSVSLGLSKSISLGKVSARKKVARHSLESSEASLQDYMRNLWADATIAYIDAVMARDMAEIQEQSWRNMRELSQADSLRNARGDLSELDVMQSRIEASMTAQEWRQQLSEYHNSVVKALSLATTQRDMSQPLAVGGKLYVPQLTLSLQQLIDTALCCRADLVALAAETDAARAELSLTRRERVPDMELSVGVSRNSRVLNEEAPAPEYTGYTVGLGIPLPVSNINRGSVKAANVKLRQSALQEDALKNQICTEVTCAYNDYMTALRRANSFNVSLMAEAKQVLDGRLYAYNRGESSLLEVITAQHTYNEVQQAYIECLHQCLTAYVELQRSSLITYDIKL
ncbi:MAG: TolC family protein [Bacteroidales bacterium]|nr:TolC family protein [Bacteroidales bacterium]